MSSEVTIEWDPFAGAWRLGGRAAGAAGFAEVQVGGVSWRVDWMDPGVLVEAYVVVPGDSPASPVPAEAVRTVGDLCGDEVARHLATSAGAEVAPRAAELLLDPDRHGARLLAGRLAIAVELAEQHPAPGWWDVEAASAALALGPSGPDPELTDELVDRAVEVLDAVPAELLARLGAARLAGPLTAVMLRSGTPEAELPDELRLSGATVDARFDQLVDVLALEPAGPLDRFLAPTFRRAARVDPGERRPVEWIEVPVGELREAHWQLVAGVVRVTLLSEGPLPEGICVRLVDARGRAPVVLDRATPVPTSTADGVTTWVCEFAAPQDPGPLRVELVASGEQDPVSVPRRGARHATSLARSAAHLERRADAETRSGSIRAVDSARSAARQWSAALGAWEGTGAADLAAQCATHERRLARLARGEGDDVHGGDGERAEGTGGSGEVSVAGWAESALVVALDHLADASEVGGTTRSVDEWSRLASLAESVGDLTSAARFRAEQARASEGAAREVLVRVVLGHHERLGTRPPRDLESHGAAGA